MAPDGGTAILVLGDPRLTERCTAVGGAYHGLASDLARLTAALAEARARLGFGRAISAPQIGLMRRIIAIDLGAGPFALIDPEIVWRSDDTLPVWDDCLSVPDRLVRVRRHRSISVRYLDERFRAREWPHLPFDLSELVQHEIDHLDGVLMVDRADGDDAVRPIARRAELVDAARPAHRLSLARIAEAARTIDAVFVRSPRLTSAPLSERARASLTLKVETVNPIRSFKGRGADYFVGQAVADGERGPLVCASAGNFGQAMAYACGRRGIALTVFVARSASPLAVARIRALGAELVHPGDDFEAAKACARAWAAERGARFVEDGREPAVSEGAGSIAVELFARNEAYDDAFDAVVVPVGDGALISGIARWVKAASPATRVIGVCSRGAPAVRDAWRRGPGAPIVAHERADTIADGIAVRAPVAAAVADMIGLVDDIVVVDDAQLLEAMRLVHAHHGLVVEPSGVAGVAAILGGRAGALEGKAIATVLTGGNVTREQMQAWRLLDAA
ncbi:MAG TPA: pyridoxal-phosphate dependent enzyme [Kofleriaceae bacterium]|nr:pyridoxal-phosphate dependent enzyme [Kofleriaceae bacterium]